MVVVVVVVNLWWPLAWTREGGTGSVLFGLGLVVAIAQNRREMAEGDRVIDEDV